MEDLLLKLIILAFLAATPIGELLIAYPVGLSMGIDPLISLLVSLIFNIIPIPFLLILFERISTRFERFFKWVSRRGSYYRNIKKMSLITFLALTPIFGVYATSFVMKTLYYENKVGFLVQTISLIIYGIILYFGAHVLLGNLRGWWEDFI